MQRTSVSMLNLLLLYKSNHQHSGSADGGLHFIDVSFHNTQKQNKHQRLLIDIKLTEPATGMYNLYSAQSITIITTSLQSLHSFPSIYRVVASLGFNCKSFTFALCTTSFYAFPGLPLFLVPSTSKVTHFFHPIVTIIS